MDKIGFIVDSSSGIKNSQYPDVYVLPLIVSIQDKDGNIKTYHDNEDISLLEICKKLNEKNTLIKTSQASMGEIVSLVESIYDKYDRIYVLPIPSKISGSLSTWKILANDYPKLFVYEQYDVTLGLEWTILDLLKMVKSNLLNDDSFKKYMDEINKHKRGYLFVNDLSQLVLGGRVSNLKSLVANLLGLKIIITLDNDGLNFFKTTKSVEKGLDLILEENQIRQSEFDINKVKRIAFICPPTQKENKDFLKIIELLKEKTKTANCQYSFGELPGIICSHTGDDVFAIYLEE